MKGIQRVLPLGVADSPGPSTGTGRTRARDHALGTLEATRADLLAKARTIAWALAGTDGTVTSPDVVAEMRQQGYGAELDAVDLRFLGAVFRCGWERAGWVTGRASPGSHARPVAVWRRK